MAISWGAWSSNTRLRCGVEVTMSPSSVTSSTTSVTLTTKVYLQSYYASNETSSSTDWWITGSVANGSGNTDWNLGAMAYVLMGQTTTTVTLQYGSTQSYTGSGKIHSYYAYPGTEATASQSITVPARPYTAPAAPSGLAVARASDTQQNLSWTNHATTGAPYSNIEVARKDNVSTSFATIATLSGSATSYSDTTTKADRVYTYEVRAKNSVGYSAYNVSGTISTTPAAPGTPSAAKNTTGDIVVTRGSLSGDAAGGWEVWHAAGGVWDSARLALVATGTTTYTHASPDPAVTHQYRLKAVSTGPTLYSAYSTASNVVQLLTAPNAPTNLAPSGKPIDATEATTLSWTYNTVDTSAQRKVEMQYRIDGGAWTSAGVSTQTTQTWNVPGGYWTNGHTVEWQVRTWGAATSGGSDGTGASAWSASGTLTTSSRPTVNITAPDPATAYALSVLTVQWGYYDAEGTTQAQWRVRLYASDGTTLLETRSGTDASTQTDMQTHVTDGSSYVVTAEVQDGSGLWSLTDSVSFSVSFALPPAPTLSAQWVPDTGGVTLTVDVADPVDPQVAADHVDVYRSINGGEYALVATGLPLHTTLTDYIPALNATNTYKAVAVSTLPSVAEATPLDVSTSGATHAFVNAGTGWADSVRVESGVSIDITTGRARTLRRAAGRTLPVPFDGSQQTTEVSLSAVIFKDTRAPERAARSSTWQDIADFALSYSPACFRDPDGNRLFVSMSPVRITGLGVGGVRGVSWSLTQVAYSEQTSP